MVSRTSTWCLLWRWLPLPSSEQLWCLLVQAQKWRCLSQHIRERVLLHFPFLSFVPPEKLPAPNPCLAFAQGPLEMVLSCSLPISLAPSPCHATQWRVGHYFARLARAFEGNSFECFPGLVPCSEAKIKNELAKGSKLVHALEGLAEVWKALSQEQLKAPQAFYVQCWEALQRRGSQGAKEPKMLGGDFVFFLFRAKAYKHSLCANRSCLGRNST